MNEQQRNELTPAVVLIGLALLLLASSQPAMGASVTTYQTIALGPLTGSASTGYGLNESGVVAGTLVLPSGASSGFIGAGAGVANLPQLPGAVSSQARNTNNNGQVVGTSHGGGSAQATVWSNGNAEGIGSLGGGQSYGTDINDVGQVVGSSTTVNGQGHAYVYQDGTWTDIGADWDGRWSAAYGINESGQVAGYGLTSSGEFRGFLWNGAGDLTSLGTLGGSASYAHDVNGSGAVVGNASLASGNLHAFVASDGVMIDLGTLGGSSSFAYGINDAGAVVGHSWLADDITLHAYLYLDGAMLDLNDLIPDDSAWVLLEAYDINGGGQITGVGLLNGQRTAYRLDPIYSLDGSQMPEVHAPEPGTISTVLLGSALIGIGLWRRRRRGSHGRRTWSVARPDEVKIDR